jgi:predicted nucleic acid-binding protein
MLRDLDRIMIDTNVLYDLYFKNERTELARSIIKEKELFVSQSVFYEIGSLLKKRIGARSTAFVLEDIKATIHIIPVTTEQEDLAMEVMKKYEFNNPKKEYTFTDAIQLVQSGERNIKLYTSDEAMTRYREAQVYLI